MNDSSSVSADFSLGGTSAHRPTLMGTQHMVVAGHYGAAHSAFAILEAGGNAVDAGVAAGIALGVFQCDIVNVAGVAPIIFREAATGQVHTIAGLGRWPQLADPERFRRENGGISPTACCVPSFRPPPTRGSPRSNGSAPCPSVR